MCINQLICVVDLEKNKLAGGEYLKLQYVNLLV